MILKLYWPGQLVAEEGRTGVEREDVEEQTLFVMSGRIESGSGRVAEGSFFLVSVTPSVELEILSKGEVNQSINQIKNKIKSINCKMSYLPVESCTSFSIV